MKVAAIVFFFAALPAFARAEQQPPPKQRWLPLVKGAVYHYTGRFDGAPYDSHLQVQDPQDPERAEAGILAELGADRRERVRRIAAGRPLLNEVWEKADGIYATIGPWNMNARIVALPPEVGARTEVSALLVDTEMIDPKTTFIVETFDDLEVPAGSYRHCLKVRYQAGAVDGHVWFARGTGIVKWANQHGQAELASYAPSPTASKRAVDALVSRCKQNDDAACVEVGSALLAGLFANTGERVRKDPARGLASLKPACERGAGGACGPIGQYELQERGDSREAEKWFRRGCDLGDKVSCASTPEGARASAQVQLRGHVKSSVNILRVFGKGNGGANGGAVRDVPTPPKAGGASPP